ncbi:MAG: ATP-binding cassette domain-containing protein [Actinomycetota bacterium]
MTDAAAVRVRDLEVRYARGGEPAVGGVSFEASPGDVVLLTGPAGCGKSTVLHALLGLAPAAGEVSVLGRPPGAPDVLRRVGYAPQGRPVDRRLTARETARLVAAARGLPAGEADAALERLGVAQPQRLAGRLDPEEMRRLTLALADMGAPDLVVLDDPWEMPETVEVIDRARGRGATVLVAIAEPGGLAGSATRTLQLVGGRAT